MGTAISKPFLQMLGFIYLLVSLLLESLKYGGLKSQRRVRGPYMHAYLRSVIDTGGSDCQPDNLDLCCQKSAM